MKYKEIVGNLRIYISNEEDALISKIEENQFITKSSLDEREKELARLLVSKGVLNRVKRDETTTYVVNSSQDIIRD